MSNLINTNTNVNVKIFNFEMLDVETIFENDIPYFKLTDIEKVLELSKGCSRQWLKEGWFDEDEVKLRNSQHGGHPLKYVAESGLYRILNKTNSPKARPFERWVTNNMMPSIRKNACNNIESRNKYLPQSQESSLQMFNWNNANLDYGLLNGEPVFKLSFIENLLGITNIRQTLDTSDTDYVIKVDNSIVCFTYNRKLHNTGELFLTEAGLYKVMLRSNKPEAEKFSLWVTKEVLPSIRKNGGYIANQENMSPAEIVAHALIVANNIIIEKEKTIEHQKEVIEYQEVKLNNFNLAEANRRSKQELRTELNRAVRMLADQKFNKNYKEAYRFIYNEFSKLHCIKEKITMEYLSKNNDYLAECLTITTSELN